MNFRHFTAVLAGMILIPILRSIFWQFFLMIEHETEMLILSHGKMIKKIRKAGLHFVPEKVLPWVRIIPVSLQKDFRDYPKIHVNDSAGTTVLVDLWVEFRIEDAERALFKVEDWESSMKSLLTHAATSILGNKSFDRILKDRSELAQHLQDEVSIETRRWGIRIEGVHLRKVSLLPEVSQQMFESISAQLERAKASIEEEGKLKVQMLDARTSAQVAELVAQAKGQYPSAVGRAYSELAKIPEVLAAYQELYDLSMIKSPRLVTFRGFDESGKALSAQEAVMTHPANTSTGAVAGARTSH